MRIIILISLCLSFVAASAQTPIASWNFNGDAKDKSGNGWDATVFGCTLTAGKAGKPNTAYNFNGTGNYMIVPHQAAMNMTSWTMMALVKPKGFFSGACQDNMILERGFFYTGSSHSLFFCDNPYDNSCNTYTPNKMVFEISAAGTSSMSQQNGVFIDTVNTWYCVAATYGNDTAKIYVNGAFVEKIYWPNQYGSGITDSLRIGTGTKQQLGYPNWFHGIMDHINIYNSALSLAQIDSACNYAANDTGTVDVNTNDTTTTINHVYEMPAQIIISPNPSARTITVTLPSVTEEATVYIINAVGQLIMTQSVDNIQSDINIEKLPAGIYIIKVAYKDEMLFGRVLKE
jgi:hypothetical protein